MATPLLTLDIEKPTAGGRMLARHNGQIVLVWGAIPGERVRARIERGGKDVLFAETVEVLSPSPDRRAAIADWRCGGNVLAHATYDRQLQIKSEIVRDGFARIAHVPLDIAPDVMASPEEGYRMRARLHVRGSRIGFMREGSHEICAVGPTRQMLSAASAWIEAAESRMRADRLKGLTSVEIAENIPGTERACHLELEAGTTTRVFAALATDGITGLSARVLDRHGIESIVGVQTVSDSIGGVVLKRDVRAFFQSNRFLLEPFVQRVTALVPETGPVCDLYAGVGLFGLSLAAAGRGDITLVEGDAISAHDLDDNARPFARRLRVERSSVEEFLRRRTPPSAATVIVDPPRTGMSREAIGRLLQASPARVIYVSCDVATLARDVRMLVDADYALEVVSAVDLFPNTAHVETIAVFQRQA